MFQKINIATLCMLLWLAATLQAQTPECPSEPYIPGHFGPDRNVIEPPLVTPPPSNFPPPTNDARTIYWVHGLGGSSSSWSEARVSTDLGTSVPVPGSTTGATLNYPARKTIGFLPTYVQTSMDAAALDLIARMNGIQNTATPGNYSNDFIISHSQGGLVSRFADQIHEFNNPTGQVRRFQGVVTFASPHGGAQILNSRDNGLLNEYISDLCSAVLTSSVATIFMEKPILGLFIDPQQTYNTVNTLCDGVSNLLPFALSTFMTGSTAAFTVGAAPLEDLNAYGNPVIYKAAVSAVEYADGEDRANPQQLFWRTMSSYSRADDGPAFTNNEDDALVIVANNTFAEYYAKYEAANINVLAYQDRGFPKDCVEECLDHLIFGGVLGGGTSYILCKSLCDLNNGYYHDAVVTRDALYKAVDWLRDADDQWKIMIGALDVYLEDVPACECRPCYQYLQGGECVQWGDPVLLDPAYCSDMPPSSGFDACHEALAQVQVKNYRESDGIVNLQTQEAWVDPFYRMEKTNHFQARNCFETARALLKLFQGGGDPWFNTLPK